jgi:site-specific DNA-methyltransferase (cytosine-N4-specific)
MPDSAYSTSSGRAYLADSLELLKLLPSNSVDLIITSPPYALVHEKAYGNESEERYVAWFLPFAEQFHRVLRKTGSLVLEFGGSWMPGRPVKSLYQYRLLLELTKTFHLAQEFYWYNSAKLPSPAEWVNVRRWRLKDAVTSVWWLSKTDTPKADNRRVLYPYGVHMERLFEVGYNHGLRPSEHRISTKWGNRNRGSISPNILICSNTISSDPYQNRCRAHGLTPHPARFPAALPRFFIRFLTQIGDVVIDPFAGSNTTGREAESHNRHWLAVERDPNYLRASSLRFFENPVLAPSGGSPLSSRLASGA